MLTYAQLDKIADSVNPALTALLTFIFFATAQNFRPPQSRVRYVFGVIVGLLLTWVLAHINRWLHLWPEHHLFPSGHMTYALCIVTSLCLLRPDQLKVIFAAFGLLLAAYAWLMVYQRYHDWLDIVGAVAMSPPVTLLGHRLCGSGPVRPGPVSM